MSFFGWVITFILAWLIYGYAQNNQWGFWKKLVAISITYFICNSIFGDNLEDAGKDYILQHLKSPSSAKFHSYTGSSTVKETIEENWGIEFKDNCDIVLIEVEATNSFGGRERVEYAVFFKDGEPIDMIDADGLTKSKIQAVFSWLDF